MVENEFYNQIMELPGLDDMKEIIKNWNIVPQNISKNLFGKQVILPDLLWSTKSGVGKTYLLKLLSEYLYSVNLMDFYGDTKYFEFLLEYCEPYAQFEELTRLIQDVKLQAGYRNEYRGVIAIDVSPWKEHFTETYFIRVMEYLSSIDSYNCLIFVAENFEPEQLDELENILSSFFRLRTVELTYPSVDEFNKYMVNMLEGYGYSVEKDANILLHDSIEELIKSELFDGYKTICRMCQDIAFDLCTQKEFSKNIKADMIQRYAKDGEFVNNLKIVIKKRRIGFGGVINE